ncbi:unnamed protein product [Chrysodeixis includens]|uniref:Uncharacterized protein n=1 Tax=Chrysodeixis includens TaxID=689277 RepID=A0A9N8L4K1_CHRIL|nr:unnamed protein product [Chrysodeixis includens]
MRSLPSHSSILNVRSSRNSGDSVTGRCVGAANSHQYISITSNSSHILFSAPIVVFPSFDVKPIKCHARGSRPHRVGDGARVEHSRARREDGAPRPAGVSAAPTRASHAARAGAAGGGELERGVKEEWVRGGRGAEPAPAETRRDPARAAPDCQSYTLSHRTLTDAFISICRMN